MRHRLSPHRPGILDDLFADTKTLRLPPQALANAMNHLTDTDTDTQRTSGPTTVNHITAPYGSPTPPTASAPLGLYIAPSFSPLPVVVTPPTLLMPPTARQGPLRPRHLPHLFHLPDSGSWSSRRSPRPRRVFSVCLLVAGCSCLSSTPVVHGRSVLQLLASPPLSCLIASAFDCTPAAAPRSTSPSRPILIPTYVYIARLPPRVSSCIILVYLASLNLRIYSSAVWPVMRA